MKGLKELHLKQQELLSAGGLDRLQKQRAGGKRLTARERVLTLLDQDSFVELDAFVTHNATNFGIGEQKFLGDGVITGFGTVHGRYICVFSQDFTVFGGSLAAAHAKKIIKVMEHAEKIGCPVIGINDSGGARIHEGVESLGGYADIFLKNTLLSGVVPQISLVMGPCAGGAVYSPAITDFIFMVDHTSHMFITGPEVIKQVTREDIDKESLGGAHTHESVSGVCHKVCSSDEDALNQLKILLSFLPQNNLDPAPRVQSGDTLGRINHSLQTLVPDEPNKPYDIKSIIVEVADNNDFFELQENFAQNIVTGFIRLNGQSIGVVANQPMVLAGCLDINASTKAARFVRFCDAFSIPLVTLVDVPGFLPGIEQEHGGIIRHGAKLLYAYAESTVPKVTVITRKAYGGAYDVMASKHIRADVNLSYPGAEIAVMGAEGAVQILFRKEIESLPLQFREERRKELIESYKDQFSNPWEAARLGFIDAVIEPKNTRKELIKSFAFLEGKSQTNPKKKHGNIPL
jgi:propionyl-CoA carboxylase beta chain